MGEIEYQLLRNGEEVYRGTEQECVKYIHDNHSFSLAWAERHEGYKMQAICPGCYESQCECVPRAPTE